LGTKEFKKFGKFDPSPKIVFWPFFAKFDFKPQLLLEISHISQIFLGINVVLYLIFLMHVVLFSRSDSRKEINAFAQRW